MTGTGKKYFDLRFDLIIDGTDRPSAVAAALFQRDPFPGGHKYQLIISGKRLGELFYYIEPGKQSDVPEEVASRCFLTMGGLLAANATEGGTGIEYFLNSIDHIEYDCDRIKFFGVCSPVVRAQRDDA